MSINPDLCAVSCVMFDITLLQCFSMQMVWPGSVTVRMSDLRLNGHGFESQLCRCQVTALGKLFTHMCLCHQTVQLGTSHWAVMPLSWEGNHWSAVSLAMRHRLKWFIYLRAQGLSQGDEAPRLHSAWSMSLFIVQVSRIRIWIQIYIWNVYSVVLLLICWQMFRYANSCVERSMPLTVYEAMLE